MVEGKCIEVDNAQDSRNDPTNKLNIEDWQALIPLHRTLLRERHDFFLASQHPLNAAAARYLPTGLQRPRQCSLACGGTVFGAHPPRRPIRDHIHHDARACQHESCV
ncbi:hypothetical protein B0T21DRAFT_343212 [Apiosordaria backusii]|uniref:Uncharacterized protein n=1 Tax=Apiosordaria backusii TaxID=314023 RepID=A0AA40EXP5_9PEZI|nr:hypothetical protein B0T21DRAFT_343212 [Apiosordaria backusii]